MKDPVSAVGCSQVAGKAVGNACRYSDCREISVGQSQACATLPINIYSYDIGKHSHVSTYIGFSGKFYVRRSERNQQ